MPVLVIQEGHTGRTSGATGTAGEQVLTDHLGDEIAAAARDGWTVRIIDADEPAASYACDVFLAIHVDGGGASGASVGYPTPEGQMYAQRWKAAYKAHGWPYGFHGDNYTKGLRDYYAWKYALRYTRGCFLIEFGMYTQARDRQWIDTHHAEMVASVWDAIAGAQDKEEPVSISVITAPPAGWQRVWELYHPASGNFLYTSDPAEVERALNKPFGYILSPGWGDKGYFDVALGIPASQPLSRFYDPSGYPSGYHKFLVGIVDTPQGYKAEGVIANVDLDNGVRMTVLGRGRTTVIAHDAERIKRGLADGWVVLGTFGCGIVQHTSSDANEQIATLEAKLDKCAELARQILAVTA